MSRTRTPFDSLRARAIDLFERSDGSSALNVYKNQMVLSQGCHGLAVGSDKTRSYTHPSIMPFSLSLKLRCVSHGRHPGPASWQLQRVEDD